MPIPTSLTIQAVDTAGHKFEKKVRVFISDNGYRLVHIEGMREFEFDKLKMQARNVCIDAGGYNHCGYRTYISLTEINKIIRAAKTSPKNRKKRPDDDK